jgi:imidazolonepropionase-like amidohydrolase
MNAFVITNARIFDGTGREPFAGTVVVEGNRISDVRASGATSRGDSPPSTVSEQAALATIDARGGFLMPGLIESHAHPSFADITSLELTRLPVEEHLLATIRNAKTMLDCGYTSAFSAAAAKPRLDVVLKREIDAGRVPGPRLLANGPELTVTGGLGDNNLMHLPWHETPAFAWVVDGADDVRRVARKLAKEGVDLLKLNLSGDHGTSSAPSEQTVMSDDEAAAAMEVARTRGLRVAAHCRSAESVVMAVRHGITAIYHANYADERALDALESARDRVFVAPAAGITYQICHNIAGAHALEHELESTIDVVAKMRRRGIRVLPGGDYGFPINPHGAYARDLELFVKVFGFSPVETLVAATRHGGELMGHPGELGVIKAGALADLLMVDGDPLADIAILQDRSAIRMIVKDGVRYKG